MANFIYLKGYDEYVNLDHVVSVSIKPDPTGVRTGIAFTTLVGGGTRDFRLGDVPELINALKTAAAGSFATLSAAPTFVAQTQGVNVPQ